MLACAVLGAAGGLAGQIDQSVTLKPGWNAVYVSVAPKASADETFADWPVMSVSAYDARAFLSTASNAGGFTGEGVVRAPYLIWTREAPAASALKALAADSVLVCFSTNASAYTAHLRGVPAAPRIAWHETKEGLDVTTTRNAVGVRVSASLPPRWVFRVARRVRLACNLGRQVGGGPQLLSSHPRALQYISECLKPFCLLRVLGFIPW